MRFGPKFTSLPTTVPLNLYLNVKVNHAKPRPLDTPNDDQKRLIRSVAKMLPERIWFDPMVFPQREGVLLALSQLSEVDLFLGGWLDTTYSALPSPGGIALFNSSNQLLIEGHSGDVLGYAMRFCRRAIPIIINLHRLGHIKHPQMSLDLAENLRAFRKVRLISPGLNRVSKVEELDAIDQDKTINKFYIGGFRKHPLVYHLGAGTNVSSSQRPLMLEYERVVLVDPNCKNGENSLRMTWQEALSQIPPEADIVSDVAYGDGMGLVEEGALELVQALYELCTTRLVMVKIPLMLGYTARGFVHCKPRPHNLELIVVLDPDGDPLDEFYHLYGPDIIKTNEERNEQILSYAFNSSLKPVYNTSMDLYKFITTPFPKLPPPQPLVSTPKKSRNDILVSGEKKNRLSGRHVAWYRLLHDSSFKVEGPTVLLPNTFYIKPGPFTSLDPGLADVELSLRSVMAVAVSHGYAVKFVGRQWHVV